MEEQRYLDALSLRPRPGLAAETCELCLSEIRTQDAPYLLRKLLMNRVVGPAGLGLRHRPLRRAAWDVPGELDPEDGRGLPALPARAATAPPRISTRSSPFWRRHVWAASSGAVDQSIERLGVNVRFVLEQRPHLGSLLAQGVSFEGAREPRRRGDDVRCSSSRRSCLTRPSSRAWSSRRATVRLPVWTGAVSALVLQAGIAVVAGGPVDLLPKARGAIGRRGVLPGRRRLPPGDSERAEQGAGRDASRGGGEVARRGPPEFWRVAAITFGVVAVGRVRRHHPGADRQSGRALPRQAWPCSSVRRSASPSCRSCGVLAGRTITRWVPLARRAASLRGSP